MINVLCAILLAVIIIMTISAISKKSIKKLPYCFPEITNRI